MALTDAQTAFLDAQLGPGLWKSADLEARITRTGDIRLAAREVLDGAFATFLRQPANLAIPGEVSIGVGENIRALEKKLEEFPAAPTPEPPPDAAPVGGARIVRPDTSRWRR